MADEGKADAANDRPLVVVVMDPLAKPLSCPCVEGYAQRDYDQLGAALEGKLHRKVKVVYHESLKAALKKDASTGADLVIGKQSVVLHDAKAAGVRLVKVAMLTGKDGATTQNGLIVVATEDPAKNVADLAGYRMFFGPAECDEKHAAALKLLKSHGVTAPDKIETAAACDEGAIKILELAPQGIRGFAVISSYAKPLLEGCGQVKKGSLRVVAETEAVPFIAAYVSESLDAKSQAALRDALFAATEDPALRIVLETKRGFVADEKTVGDKTSASAKSADASTPTAKKK